MPLPRCDRPEPFDPDSFHFGRPEIGFTPPAPTYLTEVLAAGRTGGAQRPNFGSGHFGGASPNGGAPDLPKGILGVDDLSFIGAIGTAEGGNGGGTRFRWSPMLPRPIIPLRRP